MEKRRPPANNEELLRTLAELFDQVDAETAEEVDAILREEGYNPSEVAAAFQSLAQQALKDSPYNWKNRARREIQSEKARLTARKPTSSLNRTELIAAIQQGISKVSLRSGLPAGVYHRNFEKLTDDDLKSLLEELEYLTPPETGETTAPGE